MIAELSQRRVFRVVSGYAVVCFVLLQIADVTFEPLEISNNVLKIIIATMLIALPIVAYMAWVFDVDPAGEVKRAKSSHPWLEASLAGVAILILGAGCWFVLSRFAPAPLPVDAVRTADHAMASPQVAQLGIAVLPLRNLSAVPENQYFSDGIAEEIITKLSRVAGLRVIARTSSFSFRDGLTDAREIGRILNFSHILEGGVRRADKNVRIDIRLVDARSGAQLWAEQFDRELIDVFKTQTEIALNVVRVLQPEVALQLVGGDGPVGNKTNVLANRGTTNVAAYESYLKGRHFMANRDASGLQRAVTSFNEAIELDPDYLLAYSGLLDSLSLQTIYGFTPVEVYYQSAAAPTAVLELAPPQDVEVVTSLGQAKLMIGDVAAGTKLLEQAIAMDGEYPQAYIWLARVHFGFPPYDQPRAQQLLQAA